jgi:hypothetical protein
LYNKTDRRKYTRFNVPGAKVKYDEEKDFQGSEGFTGLGKMIDLTIYAVKFETQHKLTPGAKIQIWITLDDNKNIPMVGYFQKKTIIPRTLLLDLMHSLKKKASIL